MTAHAHPLFAYVDIECIPSQDTAVLEGIKAKHVVAPPALRDITAAANLVDQEKILADIQKKRAKAISDYDDACDKSTAAVDAEYRKTCFDATTGHIACLSLALNDGTVESFVNEALKKFIDDVQVDLDTVLAGERLMLNQFFAFVENTINEPAIDLTLADWNAKNASRLAASDDHFEFVEEKAHTCA